MFTFTRAGLAEVDRRAVLELGIPILVLMENAGRAVSDAVMKVVGHGKGREVVVVCGAGNNGGDGLVAARHLHNAGVKVTVLLVGDRGKFKEAAGVNLEICERMKLPVFQVTAGHAELRDVLVEAAPEVVLVDAVFGTGLIRKVEGVAAEVIRAMNGSRKRIVAVDVPSGMDADTGLPVAGGSADEVIRAVETVSMCGGKVGFGVGKEFVGKVVVGDIGAPRELLEACAGTT
jgi:NAD(P)H-hydrate epimerase